MPDDSLTIDEGAVAPWNILMWTLMTMCRAMGVRTDVPFRDLTDAEKEIVYHGQELKSTFFTKPKAPTRRGELDFTLFQCGFTVENALAKVRTKRA